LVEFINVLLLYSDNHFLEVRVMVNN